MRSRVKNETSASGSAPAIVGGGARGCVRREHLLRVEARDVGGQFGHRERKIAGHAHERAHAHDLAVVGAARRGGHADDLARGVGFAGRRQPVGLAGRVGPAVGDVAGGAAQRGLDAFRHGREIGLAVERRENGAAHQGRAAKAGQDRAAEPLDGDAAAIDQIAGLAVDRQRRLRCRDRCARHPRSHEMRRVACRDPSPTSPPPASAGGSPNRGAERDRDSVVDLQDAATAPRPPRSVNDRSGLPALWWVTPQRHGSPVTADVSSPRTDTSPDRARGAEECGCSAAPRTAFHPL